MALSNMKYRGVEAYTDKTVLVWCLSRSRYVSVVHAIKVYLPLLIMALVIVMIICVAMYGRKA